MFFGIKRRFYFLRRNPRICHIIVGSLIFIFWIFAIGCLFVFDAESDWLICLVSLCSILSIIFVFSIIFIGEGNICLNCGRMGKKIKEREILGNSESKEKGFQNFVVTYVCGNCRNEWDWSESRF